MHLNCRNIIYKGRKTLKTQVKLLLVLCTKRFSLFISDFILAYKTYNWLRTKCMDVVGKTYPQKIHIFHL